MKKLNAAFISISASQTVKPMLIVGMLAMSLTASATLPADHLATLRKDVKKVAATKPTGKAKKAGKVVAKAQPSPRMVTKDELEGDAQPLDDQLEIEALNDTEDVNLGQATNGTLAMQNGIKANGEINSVQTILKGWQPISTPSLPTITTTQKK